MSHALDMWRRLGCCAAPSTEDELAPASSRSNIPKPQKQQVTYWERNEGPLLDEPLKHVKLIWASALIELAELQARQRSMGEEVTLMPRCQDWPREAIADADMLRQWSKEHIGSKNQITGVPIIVLSICWLDPEHPDRFGEQLEQLLPIFRIYAAAGPFAVLWDYCSLPQRNLGSDDRTPEQMIQFKAGLKTINRWYVHRLTTVILVRKLPANLNRYKNPTAYENRGWTTTEQALASIVKSSSCLLDTSKLKDAAEVTMESLFGLTASRLAPLEPGAFDVKLRADVANEKVKFTAKGDLDIVSQQYETGFKEQISSTQGLYYARLGWDDAQVERLCLSLRSCPAKALERLRLHGNNLTDDSAQRLAKALAAGDSMPKLRLLNIEANHLSEEGVRLLDIVCTSKGVQLRVDNQDNQDFVPGSPGSPGSPYELSSSIMSAQSSVPYFVVPSGPLAGSFDAVYVSTDLEPDDVVAIKALAPRLRRVPILCVVGEHTLDKRSMMSDVLRHCGVLNARVVSGRRSQEIFPEGIDNAFVSSRVNTARASGAQPDFSHRNLGSESAERAACAKAVEGFLQAHTAPLAILLKPFHEMRDLSTAAIEKTVAVGYGSFNLTKTQAVMIEDAKAVGKHQDEQEALRQITELLSRFKRCVMVERASSVGRVESLNIEQPIWRHLQSDSKLMKLVRGWQATTLRNICRDLPTLVHSMQAQVAELNAMRTAAQALSSIAEEGSEEGSETVSIAQLGAEPTTLDGMFGKLVGFADKAEKKLGVMKDIGRHKEMQLPLADPLVAALLLDDGHVLERFLKRCRQSADKHGKMCLQTDSTSQIHWLFSSGEAERTELVDRVHNILTAALFR